MDEFFRCIYSFAVRDTSLHVQHHGLVESKPQGGESHFTLDGGVRDFSCNYYFRHEPHSFEKGKANPKCTKIDI